MFPTSDVLNKCVPLPPPDVNAFTNVAVSTAQFGTTDSLTLSTRMAALTSSWNGASERLERYFQDMTRSWELILVCGIGASLVLSLLWMLLIRWKAGVMIWTTIIVVTLACIIVSLLCAVKAGIITEAHVDELGIDSASNIAYPADGEKEIFRYITYASGGLTIILIVFTLLMVRRVNVCIACMKVAAKAVSEMPTLVLFPVLPFAFLLLFFGYWYGLWLRVRTWMDWWCREHVCASAPGSSVSVSLESDVSLTLSTLSNPDRTPNYLG